MAVFHLQIASMDRMIFDGEVQRISCRTICGDTAILARHCNYCTALGMGTAKLVFADGTERTAACIGGMLSVLNGECRLIPTTWEWSDEIDVARAERAKERAEALQKKAQDKREQALAEAKLHRALVRLGAAQVK